MKKNEDFGNFRMRYERVDRFGDIFIGSGIGDMVLGSVVYGVE